MSSFEDIETQNARRYVGHRGRGRWRWTGLRDELLGGRPSEIEIAGDMRGWIEMTELERWTELFRLAHEKLAATRSGPEPLRRPRTALGFGLLGPVAPFIAAGLVRVRYVLDYVLDPRA